jgi:hypothetical protein
MPEWGLKLRLPYFVKRKTADFCVFTAIWLREDEQASPASRCQWPQVTPGIDVETLPFGVKEQSCVPHLRADGCG